jgi:hypothetical protein
MGILAVDKIVPIPQVLRFVLVFGLLAVFSRGILPARAERLAQSVLLGVAVFFIWVGPDMLFPGYRNSFLFSNALVGRPEAATLFSDRGNLWFLSFRLLMSVVTVPIIEELFWRGWMMRWIINRNFTQIPVGSYHPEAFWIVAALFATEHGSYWDVGLVTGAIYNWWAMRTKSLTDCVIAHSVTNACLAVYVIGWQQWQFWL